MDVSGDAVYSDGTHRFRECNLLANAAPFSEAPSVQGAALLH